MSPVSQIIVTDRKGSEQGRQTLVGVDVEPPAPRIMKPLAKRWLQRSIRPMHVEDLQQLRDLVESSDVH